MKDAGERIDGVGLQGHFIVGSMSSQDDLEAVMNEFVAAGVSEVAYTEFDVKFDSLPYDDAGLEQQAQDYTTVIKACLNVEACVGWTIWDWTDKYSVRSFLIDPSANISLPCLWAFPLLVNTQPVPSFNPSEFSLPSFVLVAKFRLL